MISKKEYKGVDFVKFIMAIVVVAIHTHPFQGFNGNFFTQIWSVMSVSAVPYFFIASGFFLYLKITKEHEKLQQLLIIKSYAIKIIKLYLCWTLIYLPITIWKFANNDMGVYEDVLLFIRGFSLIGENFYSWPLWYLLSMIYSLVFIYFLIYKNQKTTSIFIASIFLFLISIFIELITKINNSNDIVLFANKLIKTMFGGTGRLFSGMLYIMIGALFAYQKLQFHKSVWILLLIIGLISRELNFPVISSFLFVLIPTAIFYFSLNIKGFAHAYVFRKSSTVIYFTHMIFFFLYTLIFKQFKYFGWDAFLVAVLMPIFLMPFILRYENKHALLKHIF